MDISIARRIVNYVDGWGMSFIRLAEQLDCSVDEARVTYAKAKRMAQEADARIAAREVKRLSAIFNMTAGELVAKFA